MIRAKGGREATSLKDLANILRNDGGLKGGTLMVALGKEQVVRFELYCEGGVDRIRR